MSGTLQPFAGSIALGSIGTGSLTHRSDYIKQKSNSSVTSLKRTSSQRSVTSSHAWAQDLELKDDSENDVLNCLNPVLLRLHNALLVRSHINLVIVNLVHWPRSKKNIA